ncbi:MAG: hypothetical protein ACRDYD_08565 [Acidimicrobiales bacterium]
MSAEGRLLGRSALAWWRERRYQARVAEGLDCVLDEPGGEDPGPLLAAACSLRTANEAMPAAPEDGLRTIRAAVAARQDGRRRAQAPRPLLDGSWLTRTGWAAAGAAVALAGILAVRAGALPGIGGPAPAVTDVHLAALRIQQAHAELASGDDQEAQLLLTQAAQATAAAEAAAAAEGQLATDQALIGGLEGEVGDLTTRLSLGGSSTLDSGALGSGALGSGALDSGALGSGTGTDGAGPPVPKQTPESGQPATSPGGDAPTTSTAPAPATTTTTSTPPPTSTTTSTTSPSTTTTTSPPQSTTTTTVAPGGGTGTTTTTVPPTTTTSSPAASATATTAAATALQP